MQKTWDDKQKNLERCLKSWKFLESKHWRVSGCVCVVNCSLCTVWSQSKCYFGFGSVCLSDHRQFPTLYRLGRSLDICSPTFSDSYSSFYDVPINYVSSLLYGAFRNSKITVLFEISYMFYFWFGCLYF